MGSKTSNMERFGLHLQGDGGIKGQQESVISQYASNVERFSSHYGRKVANNITSYSAFNLVGPPTVPSYGDYQSAMVLVR